MRRRAIGLRAPVLGVLALGVAGAALAQDPEPRPTPPNDPEVVVIDATRGRELDDTEQVRVRVRNTLAPSRSVVVSVQGFTRPEYVLGIVPANETREFIVDSRLYAGGFRVLATSGRVRIRNSVQAVGRTRSTWNLGINMMKFERLEPDGGGDTSR